ncbi:MAG: MTAP family purine nucleoside phosphorylase [Anaerolineaceae bacterium]
MRNIDTAFITGTGFYKLENMQEMELLPVSTPYGDVAVQIASLGNKTIAFIPRHGAKHALAPSQINFQANIFALHLLGVKRILSTSVSGSISRSFPPGTLVLVNQFINFSTGRKDTFYPLDGKLMHVDMTDPYCATIHQQLLKVAKEMNIDLKSGAVYGCFDGPRFETRAEIEMARRLGIDLVGQTNYPEVALARELAICYATVGFASNFAAGMEGNLTVTEVMQAVKNSGDIISRLFSGWLQSYPQVEDCSCHHALDEAGI